MSSSIEQIGNMLWESADGRTHRIKDINCGHLVNILNWINDHPDNYEDSEGLYDDLEKYAKHIAYFLFCEKKAYPLKNDKNGRWYLFNPSSKKHTIQPPPPEYIEYVKENFRDNKNFEKYFITKEKK